MNMISNPSYELYQYTSMVWLFVSKRLRDSVSKIKCYLWKATKKLFIFKFGLVQSILLQYCGSERFFFNLTHHDTRIRFRTFVKIRFVANCRAKESDSNKKVYKINHDEVRYDSILNHQKNSFPEPGPSDLRRYLIRISCRRRRDSMSV
jgi:hypothetical protein